MTRDVAGLVICAIVHFGASPSAQSTSVPEATPSTAISASAQKADPVWDGALWGVTIGVVTGTVTLPGYLVYDAVGADRCRTGPRVQCAAAMGAVFGGVGLLIDWLRNGQPGTVAPACTSQNDSARVAGGGAEPPRHPNDVVVLIDSAGRD